MFDPRDTTTSNLCQRISEVVIDDSLENRVVRDIDLNLPVNVGFDVNKFADEENLTPKEEIARDFLKVYLSKFY